MIRQSKDTACWHFSIRSLLACGMASLFILCLPALPPLAAQPSPPSISGIYPSLAMFNDEGECGTGAVVPWADRLWVITYAPHKPEGSSDKLYEISSDLLQTIRPESIGGTCANRFVHRESNQLFIGPYVIDGERHVRTIPFTTMFGRLTGTTRHLTSPERLVYSMTMEEGLYEVDVHSLEVKTLYHDEAVSNATPKANLPGYHGKGLYSGQGRLVYANNGEHGAEALKNPRTTSGVLAQWLDGNWQTVQRSQFTEVTGPGGIYGASNPIDPIWSMGWDHKSLLLYCLDEGRWHRWRLPKASHSYDGAHGWNTEWPRIRDIGEPDLLMTMHGMFWRFPKHFTALKSAGIQPRSRYLKVIGDFCRWQDRVVMGCDDTAKSEFLNKRKAKGAIAAPQSQSNLWFLSPEQLDRLGPPQSSGGVWHKEDIDANAVSDPFLFDGFEQKSLQVQHASDSSKEFLLELDLAGDQRWVEFKRFSVEPKRWNWINLEDAPKATWIRIRTMDRVSDATAWFHMQNLDRRTEERANKFAGIALESSNSSVVGTVRARGGRLGTLHFNAFHIENGNRQPIGLYELTEDLKLVPSNDNAAKEFEDKNAAIPQHVLEFEEASIVYVDDLKRRWRVPYGAPFSAESIKRWQSQPQRVCREIATERDLFHAGGLFYELPAENAGGFAKVSPITTHHLELSDYCSWRGLFVISGLDTKHLPISEHVVRSSDERAALWLGAADDLWELGKPIGFGGPWRRTRVQPDVRSDPYLMAGFDAKTVRISHDASSDITFGIELDVTGDGDWAIAKEATVASGATWEWALPRGMNARWMRVYASKACIADCQCEYR